MGKEPVAKKSRKGAQARGGASSKTESSEDFEALRGLWLAALVALGIGLLLSAELVRLHYAAASDPSHQSYCSVSATVSCDAVTASEYSRLFGVPFAIWGVFGYALMLVTAWRGLRDRTGALAALFAMLTGFCLVVTISLAAISHFLIHAWCLVCIGTYVVNVVSGFIAFWMLRRLGARASFAALLDHCKRDSAQSLALVLLVGGVAFAIKIFTPYEQRSVLFAKSQPQTVAPAPEASAPAPDSTEPAKASIPPIPAGARVEHGFTDEGLPWIGAKTPIVTITEFFDYQCSHCKLAYAGLHQMLELNPDRLRLVVRHFPLNPSCNRSISRPLSEHSCSFAKLANCAGKQGKFWEAHEYLFENNHSAIEPKDLAAALALDAQALDACMNQPDAALSADVEAGIALGLRGTPVFVVDGQVYMQGLPPSVADQLRSPQ